MTGELAEREPDFELVLALEQVHDIHYPTLESTEATPSANR
jgi:hypothetical protein